MIKSSHYNNNISNGSSLIVRVRYVYVHQNNTATKVAVLFFDPVAMKTRAVCINYVS